MSGGRLLASPACEATQRQRVVPSRHNEKRRLKAAFTTWEFYRDFEPIISIIALVSEVADAREDHRQAKPIGGFDDFLVAD